MLHSAEEKTAKSNGSIIRMQQIDCVKSGSCMIIERKLQASILCTDINNNSTCPVCYNSAKVHYCGRCLPSMALSPSVLDFRSFKRLKTCNMCTYAVVLFSVLEGMETSNESSTDR